MTPSTANPIYTVYVVSGSTKYNITPAVVGIDRSESKNQIAQCATIQLLNIQVGDKWLAGIINVRDRVYIYADDGTSKAEVFRGYVWSRPYKSSLTDRDLQLKCYDHLIYLQESETSVFFSSGKSTEYVYSKICGDWGIKLKYSYSSITHSKMALRGHLSDILTDDILDIVKDRTGKDYTIISDKDTMYVKHVGNNTTIYRIEAGNNAVSTSTECTMDGMVTKVIILGNSDDSGREPVEATVSGNTSKYGTLQKIIDRSENTTIASAKEEAKNIIKKDGSPKWKYEVKAVDIPWVRKGDKIYVNAGDIYQKYLIITEVDHSSDNSKSEMTLTLTEP